MGRIIEVRKGIVRTVVTLVFLAAFEGFLVYWWFFLDRYVLPFALFGLLLSLILGYVVIQNFGKTAVMAIEGPDIMWAIKMRKSPAPDVKRIPLHSLCAIEFVSSNRDGHKSSSDAPEPWKVFLVDIRGIRHQIPQDLNPDGNRTRIVAALRAANPGIKVIANGLKV